LHPSVLAQLAEMKTAELRRLAAATALVGAVRPAARWRRWLYGTSDPHSGVRLGRDPLLMSNRSGGTRTTTNTLPTAGSDR
jgi:hypothetical protein